MLALGVNALSKAVLLWLHPRRRILHKLIERCTIVEPLRILRMERAVLQWRDVPGNWCSSEQLICHRREQRTSIFIH